MLHKRPLSLAVSAAIGASASFMSPAFAQDESLVEEVVVTGSRIQRANLVSSSPVTQLDAEQLAGVGEAHFEAPLDVALFDVQPDVIFAHRVGV
ncbi:MAG: hypothetical protein AAGL66_12010, partial [Pseudomonadota bacterium]